MESDSNMEVEEASVTIPRPTSLPKIVEPITCSDLELASYIERYDGHTKIQRLLFIAEHSDNLQETAYRLLLQELKRGSNTGFYSSVCSTVGESLGLNFLLDNEWIETTERKTSQKLERIEAELLAAKTTMVKESIRLGYNDLGDLYSERGNLNDALKCYLRTRDYCTIPKHNSDMCVRVISVSIDLGQLRNVSNYITKAGNPANEPLVRAKLKAAAGLVALFEGQYKLAARKFVDVEPEIGDNFSTVIAAEDIALYGTLCALATLDRQELKKLVAESPSFKCFLELTPEVKSLVQNFLSGKYGECFLFLESIKPQLQLDIHLSKHANAIVSEILERMVIQYFSPYSAVDMHRMADAMSVDMPRLERLVADLISKDKISARIDSQRKTLHRRQHDVRSVAIGKVLQLAEKNVTEVKRGILRLSLMQHNFCVPQRDAQARGGSNNNASSSSSDLGYGGVSDLTRGNSSGGAGSSSSSSSAYATAAAAAGAISTAGAGEGFGEEGEGQQSYSMDMDGSFVSHVSASASGSAADVHQLQLEEERAGDEHEFEVEVDSDQEELPF